jgi:hypothetical protein
MSASMISHPSTPAFENFHEVGAQRNRIDVHEQVPGRRHPLESVIDPVRRPLAVVAAVADEYLLHRASVPRPLLQEMKISPAMESARRRNGLQEDRSGSVAREETRQGG